MWIMSTVLLFNHVLTWSIIWKTWPIFFPLCLKEIPKLCTIFIRFWNVNSKFPETPLFSICHLVGQTSQNIKHLSKRLPPRIYKWYINICWFANISRGRSVTHGCFAYKQLLYFKQQYMVIVTTVFTIHIHCTDNHCSCRGKIEFIVDTVKKSVWCVYQYAFCVSYLYTFLIAVLLTNQFIKD